MTIADLEQQRAVCESERATCLKTGNETMATWYRCRTIELDAQIAAMTNKDESNASED